MPLVRPDGLNVYSRLTCQFSDVHTDIVNPIRGYRARKREEFGWPRLKLATCLPSTKAS